MSTVLYAKPNRKILTFIKWAEVEPQGKIILQVIEEKKSISRFDLIHAVAPKLETTRTISDVVSYYQRQLKKLGCIIIETPEEYAQRTSQQSISKAA